MNFTKIKFFSGAPFRSPRAFYFINGLIVGILFYFYSEDVYERQLFHALADKVTIGLDKNTHAYNDSVIVRSLQLTHNLENNRQQVFGQANFKGFKAEYIQPVSFDLMTARGSCGSNAYVLGRLIMELGYPIRFAQMKVGPDWGGHVILEAFVENRWVVLDALYNLRFTNPNGAIASFDEVSKNWDHYKQQIPAQYDIRYKYEDVRYTNWNKIPVLLPMFKKVLTLFYDESVVNKISLRVYVLRKFHFLFLLSLSIYLLLHLLHLYVRRKELSLRYKNWINRFRTKNI